MMICPARHGRTAAGFTLVEIMVVVAILGLVAAMGLPSIIKAVQKEGMRQAVSDVQDVCFTARERAIFSKQKTAVVFYPREGRFSAEGGGGGGKVAAATLPDAIAFAMLDIFRQDFGGSEWARVFFYPDGTCDEAVIILMGRGESRKITLDYATGQPVLSAVDK
jgi:prepilin-type N-terminal cleavage/methylation domain-containing protein